jgi:hypothetical protein
VRERRHTSFVAQPRSQFDTTANGERFLMITDPQGDKAERLILVQNWTKKLKRPVPTK